ncbi:hypothetical protein B0T36_21785 [Nocardia donostiensis]|nr:hypothetical protein B0T36_21785 [Nocardia donostiensis]
MVAVTSLPPTDSAEKEPVTSRIVVAGDSVGGNMAIAHEHMAEERGDASFVQQVLSYPVTDAAFDTASHHEFAEDYFLTQREHAIALGPGHHQRGRPRTDHRVTFERRLRATGRTSVRMGITAEVDVLRDESQTFATELRGGPGRGPEQLRRYRPTHRTAEGGHHVVSESTPTGTDRLDPRLCQYRGSGGTGKRGTRIADRGAGARRIRRPHQLERCRRGIARRRLPGDRSR